MDRTLTIGHANEVGSTLRAGALMMPMIGTAGWAIPKPIAQMFEPQGSALERYASRFAAIEVNSSFHRPHRRTTWERWRDAVPAGFRFTVKIPKAISHERKLVDCDEELARFRDEVGGLGDKLAVLLLQLPPKLAFDAAIAERFLRSITTASDARVVCEPRHPSWFETEPDALLRALGVARVAADPSVVPAAAVPGGWPGIRYHRLHGSPQIYRSSYDDGRLDCIARSLRADHDGAQLWCMFDNTTTGAATRDALRLLEMLKASEPDRR